MVDYYGDSGDWSPLPTASSYVWTNGCYDILHVGHLRLLAECREQSKSISNSMFVVGIDSDERVRQLKGKDRPVNDQFKRAEMLLSIKGVSGVFIYDTTEELEAILNEIKPAVMVIGEEYRDKVVVGSSHAQRLIFFPKVEDLSTSNTIARMRGGSK